jgi:hypothetical protein
LEFWNSDESGIGIKTMEKNTIKTVIGKADG